MKTVFFGSSHFAVPCLEALIKSPYEICAVVTQPDKKKGRHLHLAPTDVKAVAKQAGLQVFQPESVNSPEALKYLKNLSADLFAVVAYGQILSQAVLDLPKIFSVNIHASLLPKYRGAAPINRAILNGEKNTGITIIQLTRKMDAGPILMQKEIPITDRDDSMTLEDELRRVGAELLMDALKEIESRTFKLVPQNEKQVIMAPKLKKEDGYIDWERGADEIYNQVRGCLPWPGAFTYYKGKLLKIYKAKPGRDLLIQDDFGSGRVVSSKNEVVVQTGRGVLVIEGLQLEAGKRMSAKDFVHGHKIRTGDILGKK